MYIQQVELTRGVGRDFVKALTEMSVKEEHEIGDILFKRGDPANYAFLLLIGRVHLKVGETGQVIGQSAKDICFKYRYNFEIMMTVSDHTIL